QRGRDRARVRRGRDRLRRTVRAGRRPRARGEFHARCAQHRRALARHRRRHLHLHQSQCGYRGVEAHVSAAGASIMPSLTPRQIVQELDKHIVGQAAAKRAVAIALRNRWRRMQVGEPLREEVTPKNILMIGPTGCGKTEISRRLAKLADAPFVKVEATKFTEVGYVGRDVEQIARDLVEEAVRLERDRRRAAVKEAAEQAAMDTLLDALTGKAASEATRLSFRQRLAEGSLDDAEVEIE